MGHSRTYKKRFKLQDVYKQFCELCCASKTAVKVQDSLCHCLALLQSSTIVEEPGHLLVFQVVVQARQRALAAWQL